MYPILPTKFQIILPGDDIEAEPNSLAFYFDVKYGGSSIFARNAAHTVISSLMRDSYSAGLPLHGAKSYFPLTDSLFTFQYSNQCKREEIADAYINYIGRGPNHAPMLWSSVLTNGLSLESLNILINLFEHTDKRITALRNDPRLCPSDSYDYVIAETWNNQLAHLVGRGLIGPILSIENFKAHSAHGGLWLNFFNHNICINYEIFKKKPTAIYGDETIIESLGIFDIDVYHYGGEGSI